MMVKPGEGTAFARQLHNILHNNLYVYGVSEEIIDSIATINSRETSDFVT